MKRVKFTTRSGVFVTNFEVFHLVMKHCVECLILIIKKKSDFEEKLRLKNEQFSFDFQTLIKHLISFVLSLSIINKFEKLTSLS